MKSKMTYKNKTCKKCGIEYSLNSPTQKYCASCGIIIKKEYQKSLKYKEYQNEYRKSHKEDQKKYYEKHKEERSEKGKEYYQGHKEERKENNLKIKKRIISHYSNGKMKCAKCGFSDLRALSLDHINGDGYKHSKNIRRGLYRWCINNNFPNMFQVLCMNCQFIKKEENGECKRKD